jgi:hypothetical protein
VGERTIFATYNFIVILNMSRRKFSPLHAASLIIGICLLAVPAQMRAQFGGLGGGGGHSTSGNGSGTPGGVAEKDGLQNFHRAMAMQATPDQRAAFSKLAQSIQSASDQLQQFRKALSQSGASPALSDQGKRINEALEKDRTGSQSFIATLSSAQKSGLQDLIKKIGKADFELSKQIKSLDQILQGGKVEAEPLASGAAGLEKALASFQNEQLTLAREMSIVDLDADQGATYKLPPVTNSVRIGNQAIAFPVSGAVVARAAAQTSADTAYNAFGLTLVADLSDMQQNITALLRAQVNKSPGCGERIQIQQATFTPDAPAGLVVADLHFERWICQPGQSATEVADGNATLEVELAPSIDQSAGLTLAPKITHVKADGQLRTSLRSGDLGITLRDQIAASILSALHKAVEFKKTLLPVAQQAATMQKARFQNDGSHQMSLVIDGQLQFSDEQAQQFVAQLKQHLAAQGSSR